MARSRPDEIEFLPDQLTPVLDRMAAVTAAGSGWINIRPIIEAEHEPPPPGPLSIFGGSIHKVPTVTWMPGKVERSGSIAATRIGLQHSGGPRLAAQLRDLGLPLPEGWRVVQDHPRRGLVVKLPDGADDAGVLDWLIRAAGTLCAVPQTGRWRAEVFEATRSNR
ncbi:MAG TPA: hypothetical protein VHZ02_05750 [Acidimicrobiales bacterium]|nr:hypothetical protein [Acidimicrobiales bacterium]